MGTRNHSDVPIVFWSLLALLIHMLNCLGANGFSIKLIPRYSIDSSLFPQNLSLLEKNYRIAELSKARALHFKSMNFANLINSTKQGIQTLQPKIQYALSNLYAVQMYIGTVPYSAVLLMDSGSDDTWLQAEGCTNCFPLRGGNFQYHDSRTYRAVSSDHPLCNPRICERGLCFYVSSYISGSFSRGIVSAENFTFTGNGGFVSFLNVVFGAGFDNQNIVFGRTMGPNNVIAGVFGLGAGRRSFLRQLASDTNLRFSYCLPSSSSLVETYTYLRFGNDATISGDVTRRVQTTPMMPGIARYYVNVTGISMDGILLPIDPAVFVLQDDGNGGFAVDSGSGATFLVWNAYIVVKNEIIRYFWRYGWPPLEESQLPYDLCYGVVPTTQALTTLTIHFIQANLVLDSKGVFQVIDNNMFCMVILPINELGPSLLGAFQQVDYRFLFDVRASTMSFVPETCLNN
ncbi:aspartic proteinase nepenthesin-1-like [Fagus crenata]